MRRHTPEELHTILAQAGRDGVPVEEVVDQLYYGSDDQPGIGPVMNILLRPMDLNGDGKLNFLDNPDDEEYQVLDLDLAQLGPKLKEAIERFAIRCDGDSNGVLDITELQRMAVAVQGVDFNRLETRGADGRITAESFANSYGDALIQALPDNTLPASPRAR